MVRGYGTMDMPMVAAAITAFVPTFLLMYAVLRRYTYPAVERPFFSDPSLFGLFAVGLVAGTVLMVVYTYFVGWWGNIIIAMMFALLLELAKLVVLNLRRYHGRSDTIFYGFGLGLGMGCTFAFGMVFYLGSAQSGTLVGDISSWPILTAMALTYILVNASTGTVVGEGIARKRPWEFLLQALLLSLAVQLLLALFFGSTSAGNMLVPYALLTASLALAAVYFIRTHFIRLPGMVRDVLRMEGRKRMKTSEE